MQERTGEIIALAELSRRMREGTLEEREAAIRESDGYVEIPASELPAVQAMNRHDRRAWAAKLRSEKKAAAARTAKV